MSTEAAPPVEVPAGAHAVLCGGVGDRGLPFDGGTPLRLSRHGRRANVFVEIDDVERAVWGRVPSPRAFQDLIDIAAYVYAADQAIRRGEPDDACYGKRWRRQLFFRIAVREPDLWNRPGVREELTSTLSFLSEDEYYFEFTPFPPPPRTDRLTRPGLPFGGEAHGVMLYSGGLDSLAGAVREVVKQRRKIVLVNHRSTPQLRQRQLLLVDRRAGRARPGLPIFVPVRVSKSSLPTDEYTRRTRSFLYASLAAAVAQLPGQSAIRIYENGVVSLNLPPCARVVGARASRTTHPRALDGFERLFTRVVGRRFRVGNTFRLMTRAEVVRELAEAGCADLIGLTTSCQHTRRLRLDRTHCGLCSQCIDRRFAVLAAGEGAHDPAELYGVGLIVGERPEGRHRTMLAVYLATAQRVARMAPEAFLGHSARRAGRCGRGETIPIRLCRRTSTSTADTRPTCLRSLTSLSACTGPRSASGRCRSTACCGWSTRTIPSRRRKRPVPGTRSGRTARSGRCGSGGAGRSNSRGAAAPPTFTTCWRAPVRLLRHPNSSFTSRARRPRHHSPGGRRRKRWRRCGRSTCAATTCGSTSIRRGGTTAPGPPNGWGPKSPARDGFQAFAVSGVNIVSFAITAEDAAKEGLLGFSVERGLKGKKPEFRPGFKVFRSLLPHPTKDTRVSTRDHPVQSFVWDDFTAAPDSEYVYRFHPIRGTPARPDRTAAPVEIRVRTEPLFSDEEHDVFFNRGVASSQAYAVRFGNKRPDDPKVPEKKRAEMRQWLSRELDEAILKFIASAGKGDTLLCCFYEFRYRPVVDALNAAIGRGVDVQVIIDAKVNESKRKDKKTGKTVLAKSFPREDNLKTIEDAGFPMDRVKLRQARKSNIHHNKFMVLLRGKQKKPAEVWTGSTNISESGIHGQTNVGHWVRNPEVAERFRAYWEMLGADPGGQAGDDRSTVLKKNREFVKAVEQIQDVPADVTAVPRGVSTVFSPRTALKVLDTYFEMIDTAKSVACITLAFGVAKGLKAKLTDNRPEDQIIFMLLEKEDRPPAPRKPKPGAAAKPKKKPEPFVRLTARNNVYQAFGAFLPRDPLYAWVRQETNAKLLKLGKHVAYIHSKFLLMDPLGDDPIVVTGSANFSEASTTGNDENMLIIRGGRRVADIYFTEFNRLFNHYYFRAVHQKAAGMSRAAPGDNLFLRETPEEWLAAYRPGTLRSKRVQMFARMRGFTRL